MRYARWIGGASVFALMMIGSPEAVSAQDDRSGVEIWSQTCGNCHRNQTGSRYSADNWRSIIMHMRIIGRLTDAEAEAVEAFLTRGSRGDDQGDEADPAAQYIESRGGVRPMKPAKLNR